MSSKPASGDGVPADHGTTPDFFGASETGSRLRAVDWRRHPMGRPEEWESSLRTSLGICLASRYPICLLWGPEHVYFYNDAYAPIVGAKHPSALGRPYPEVWPEIWESAIRPLLEPVIATGEASWADNLLLTLQRFGFNEECYFSFSFAPIRTATGAIGGVFTAITETTPQVIGQRRLKTLSDLGARTGDARSPRAACRSAAQVLSENRHEIPFALFYLLDEDSGRATLLESLGLSPGHPAAPMTLDATAPAAPWRLATVLESGAPEWQDLDTPLEPADGAPWPEPVKAAVVLPIARPGQRRPYGFLVSGVSPRRSLDDDYRAFLVLVAKQVGSVVSNARAYDEERQRALALAEIDRTKTEFFSNVSHEFRTPLTLLLGPVEAALADRAEPLSDSHRLRLDAARRNGLRLLKLVNTLLDFSRIEAGRVQAVYEPVDLSAMTTELASNFESACERAGLRLVVSCGPLPGPVHVDRDMWEKVVLNLLSNAFKFTLEGEIAVSLLAADGVAELRVQDTGTGIPPEEMPSLFERFHQVRGAKARSMEGTGIGLSLVRELVKLHGGTIDAESEPDRGSVFRVRIPMGTTHLPADRIGAASALESTRLGAQPFVEEALRWLPDRGAAGPGSSPSREWPVPRVGPARPRIVWADDNTDMREYVRGLLSPLYEVIAVADGEHALKVILESEPDLVLTDSMMPKLGGLGLLKRLRADDRTAAIPIVLLSARAGEDARTEALAAGADEYLLKPFAAVDLLARIGATLGTARVRSDLLRRERTLRAEAETLNKVALGMVGDLDLQIVVQKATDAAVELTGAKFGAFFSNVSAEVGDADTLYTLSGEPRDAFESFGLPQAAPLVGPTFRGEGVIRIDDLQRDPATWLHGAPAGHPVVCSYLAVPVRSRSGEVLGGLFFGHPEPGVFTEHAERLALGVAAQAAIAIDNARLYGRVTRDLEERVRIEEALRESERLYRAVGESIDYGVWVCDPDGRNIYASESFLDLVGITQAQCSDLGWGDVLHPDDVQATIDAWKECVRTGTAWDREHRFKGVDGAWHPILARGLPVRDEEGRITAWAGINLDISRLKRAEDELRRADRRKDEFLATLAHELRSPLAPISNGLELLKLDGSAEAVERSRTMMERQLQVLVRLVDDLMDVSRISRGRIDLRRETVDIGGIVLRALETSRPILEQGGHSLALDLPEEPAYVDADPTRLGQVFANLLTNAAKYSEAGTPVALSVESLPDAVQVTVADQGIGIPAEMLSAVFDLFIQIDSSLGRSHGGLGIGLTIVKRLVEMHGGTVVARSAGPGRGSEFRVRLPRVPPPQPAAHEGGSRVEMSPRPLRVLVADDNVDSAESLVLLLRRLGHDARDVHDGAEAVFVAESWHPHLILLDIGLPVLTGHEVCRRIRARPSGTGIVIAALTGWGQPVDRQLSVDAGFDHHFVKPLDVASLRPILAELDAAELDRKSS